MRYLSLAETLDLHDRIVSSTGGARGIRDLGALESALNQPRQTVAQVDLYAERFDPLLSSVEIPDDAPLPPKAFRSDSSGRRPPASCGS